LNLKREFKISDDSRPEVAMVALHCNAAGDNTLGVHIMNKTAIKTLLLASALAIGTTAAFAQTTYHSSRNPNLPTAAVSNDGPAGEGRDTAFGQGGSAGTHPTGANVGPGHAAMEHAN
jgi:hypothetical protein